MNNHILLNNIKNIHFIGIGGISMSGLAQILISKGYNISGSDQKASKLTKHLEELGATITIGQRKENITEGIQLVVYTAAVKDDNEELASARDHKIPTISRAVLLGQIMRDYKNSIAVSGTHGKTTTTSMVSHILLAAKKDPTISVGGVLPLIDGNIRVGKSDNFVTEACEYTNSYHEFFPYIAIIQNIEEDHLDFFKDIHEIRDSFSKFMTNVQPDGIIVINSDIPNYLELIDNKDAKFVTYSTRDSTSTFFAANITYDNLSNGSFDLLENREFISQIKLNTKGEHNISNALAAIASCRFLNVDYESIKTGLFDFHGTNRRYEIKGNIRSIKVIDDYAHHPTEIETTIKTAQKTPHNKIWVIFQPHTYTRTYNLLEDFAITLSLADGIVLTDIYAAREPDTGMVHSKDLLKSLKAYNENSYYISSFDEIEIFILQHLEANDILLTMGAGDVYLIGEDLLK